MSMKKILMLATGGTIASKDSGQGLTPAITSQEILSYVPAIGQLCQVEAIQLMNLDSTNITPRHWQEMARAVEEHYDQYDGFVITHGTDTMAYTAAALSYLIQYSEKPIVITGSQKSICLENTDARLNLYNSFLYAAAEGSHGVSLEERVLLLTLIPGMGADALEALRDRYEAVILQSFGVGGLPGGASGPLARAMESWLEAGKTIVMMTQVPYEGSDMEVYQVGYQVKEKYQLMEAYNMTLEAATAKLMWALGQTRESGQVRQLFEQPVQFDLIR